MYRSQAALSLLIFIALGKAVSAGSFNGEKAFHYTQEAVNDGPRPSGSPAIQKLQEQVQTTLKRTGCRLVLDDFQVLTPGGYVRMRNMLCTFPGKTGKSIVITGHYDTKRLSGFVGANDGGSSTGFLMELAEALSGAPRADDVMLVFFDGEEAVKQWTASDSVYGSRRLAAAWTKDGTAAKIKALINVDMIGDRDLDLLYDQNSDPKLRDLVWDLGEQLGYGAHFPRAQSGIEDDHIPFMKAGIPALDIIDFDYGPNNSYWHTPQDTMDKLSPKSFEVLGTVVLAAIRKIEAMP